MVSVDSEGLADPAGEVTMVGALLLTRLFPSGGSDVTRVSFACSGQLSPRILRARWT